MTEPERSAKRAAEAPEGPAAFSLPAASAKIPPLSEAAPGAEALRVAGITRFTTIDFPGKLSAVVFLQGCPWRCVYCHNPWMQPREFDPEYVHYAWSDVEALLKRRQGLLDGVVFSGGEPCLDPALPDAVRRTKAMGYLAGLHTGGAYPRQLEALLPMLDWVGLDVKAPPTDPELFEKIVRTPKAAAHFLESFRLLKASGVPFECRTTAHPDYLPDTKLIELAAWLKAEGVETFALQIYRRPQGMFAPFPAVGLSYPSPEARAALEAAAPRFIERRNDR